MRPLRGAGTRPALLAGLLATVLLVTGCGAGPGEQVPALQASLVRVDDALSARQWSQARAQLHALVRQARIARRAGTITAAQADRITGSADTLLSRLPDE